MYTCTLFSEFDIMRRKLQSSHTQRRIASSSHGRDRQSSTKKSDSFLVRRPNSQPSASVNHSKRPRQQSANPSPRKRWRATSAKAGATNTSAYKPLRLLGSTSNKRQEIRIGKAGSQQPKSQPRSRPVSAASNLDRLLSISPGQRACGCVQILPFSTAVCLLQQVQGAALRFGEANRAR